MPTARSALVLVLALAALRCASAAAGTAPDPGAARDAIRRTDEEFARFAGEKGLAEAFAAYAAPDATILPNGADPVRGRGPIRAMFAGLTGVTLTWKPYAAEVSASGDLGYTLGTYESRFKDDDGRPVTHNGKYCTIWKKQPDGTWKYIVDVGNPSPPPAANP
jgi:ketosteroid isomerase-like protein